MHKLAPRGIYTSGTGSSAVGLTAYVTKDPDSKEPVLESGALVLSGEAFNREKCLAWRVLPKFEIAGVPAVRQMRLCCHGFDARPLADRPAAPRPHRHPHPQPPNHSFPTKSYMKLQTVVSAVSTSSTR